MREEKSAADSAQHAEVEARIDDIIRDFRRSKGYEKRILELLAPELQKAFGQAHDYRQFVTQIIQNINVLMEQRYPGVEDLEERLEEASYEERAIYWAARLMEARLEATLILLDPDRISTGPISRFRFHGFVTKHLRIYRHQFEQKDLRMKVSGQSYGYLSGNSAAIGIIPHAFIDNAYKYAPPGSDVVVQFEETNTSISMTLASYGPVIHDDELGRIFDPLVRGREARALEAGGTGVGLALASAVAKNIGASIHFQQDRSKTHGVLVWTEFTAIFPRAEQRTVLGKG